MGNTAREINKIVAEAAKKKKEMDKSKEVEEKTDFISTAIDDRKKLRASLKKKVRDYSKIFPCLVIGLAIAFIGSIIYQMVCLYRNIEKEEWKTAKVSAEEYARAKEFVNKSFGKDKADLDQLFRNESPLTWKSNAKLIIEGMKNAGYEASSVTLDTKNKGNEALMQVTCSAQGKEDILFFIVLENDDFKILRIEKK